MTNPALRRTQLDALVEAQGATRATPPLLLSADPYFDLAGEEFGRRLLLTTDTRGAEYCLRPDFTLPIVTAYIADGVGSPAAFSYMGPIFRQRETGPAEFDQAGIELLAQLDGDVALDQVLTFARAALSIYGVAPDIRLGGVGLFEALLVQADMPDAWRPRIRNRFGHTEALDRLLTRLEAAPDLPREKQPSRGALVETVTEQMVASGLSLSEGRTPDEIADRYLEQQALDAAQVPASTLKLLRDYLAISGPVLQALSRVEALAAQHKLMLGAPIRAIRRHLNGLGEARVTFDASFSPRLDYYTGIVFEMTGPRGEILASGGQYDRLLERLGAKAPIAASGCSVWVDRLEQEVSP
ncbi:MAG: ATP phosphoribosyltransferase regulatory subunit [Candidatus Devosia phytovorans]|uniref:ATP phosphoribosyltransferase regulatory subunit n=1 Tax=Candidatus Devosia phytovorans TaxID=3121372 RepID=A0AAJ6AYY2_9HYPH|nr:ATP phosphoribosyltransferase regulatory subunit [Devosia sp.]WEK03156.1 MAG: ATP phosphoribosyltransferase regulatory subunit [Devosia sp.]